MATTVSLRGPKKSRTMTSAFDGANFWVGSSEGGFITEIRASDGAMIGQFEYGGSPVGGAAFDGANIWVSDLRGRISVLRASDGGIVASESAITSGINAQGVASDGTNIWVANSGSNSVTRGGNCRHSNRHSIGAKKIHGDDSNTRATLDGRKD